MIECEYCKKEFSSLITLSTHKKNAKYCLKIQAELGIDVKKLSFICNLCLKSFVDKRNLNNHLEKKCLIKTNFLNINNKIGELNNNLKEIEEKLKLEKNKLQEQLRIIEKLEKDNHALLEINKVLSYDHEFIKDIAKQPKNITTNNTNSTNKILNMISPLNLTNTEELKSIIDNNYDMKYIFSGQKGIAKFTIDHLLKDENGNLKYVCTDPSRQIFKYKDISGEVRKDIEAKKLTSYLVEGGIKNKACNMACEWWKDDDGEVDNGKFELLIDKAESMRTIDEDNTEFKKELVTMTTV